MQGFPKGVADCSLFIFWRKRAHNSTISTAGTQDLGKEDEKSGAEVMPSEEGGMYEGVYDHTKEAELCLEEGCQGKTDQCNGSDGIYPGRRPQPSGALDRHD